MKSGRSSRAGLAKGNSRGRPERSSSNTRHGRKSVVRVKLSPARCRLRSCFRRRRYGRSHAVHHQHRSRPELRNSLRHQRPEQPRRGVDGARFPRRRDPHRIRVESGANANAPAKPRHPFLSRCSAEPRKVSIGIRGQQGPINSPSILNARYNFVQFWDGRAKDLAHGTAARIRPLLRARDRRRPRCGTRRGAACRRWIVPACFLSLGRRHDWREHLGAVIASTLVVHGTSDLQPEAVSTAGLGADEPGPEILKKSLWNRARVCEVSEMLCVSRASSRA